MVWWYTNHRFTDYIRAHIENEFLLKKETMEETLLRLKNAAARQESESVCSAEYGSRGIEELYGSLRLAHG